LIPASTIAASRADLARLAPSRAFGAVVGALALALASAPAQAKLGDGIKVGEGRVKLGVDSDARFDSLAGIGNYGANGSGTVANPGDLIWRTRGVLQFDVPGEVLRATATANVDWNQYLGVVAATRPLSFLGASANAAVGMNPNGALGFDASGTFIRTDRVTIPNLGIGVLSNQGTLKLRPRWRPGGENGGAIELGASYDFALDAFAPQLSSADARTPVGCQGTPECVANLASGFSSLTNRVGLDAKWRILPRTGFTLEVDYGFRNYLFDLAPPEGGNPVPNVDAQPIRAQLGFGSLLTTKFFFALRAGYAGIVFGKERSGATVPMQNDFIGQAELGLRVNETIQGRLGFLRSLEPIGGAGHFYGSNRVYVDFRAQFARLITLAALSLDLVNYGGTLATRRDQNVVGTFRGDYNFNDWFRVYAGFGAFLRNVDGVSVAGVDAFKYARFEITAGVGSLF
jgi:hypothetical protein